MSAFTRIVAGVSVLGATVSPAGLTAQSASEVFSRMLAEQDRRAAAVQNYTVVQELMGTTMTMYLVKDASGPHAVFRVRDMIVEGMAAPPFRAPEDVSADLWTELPTLAAQARYVGRETIDGAAVHVVEVPDLSKSTAFRQEGQTPYGQFEPKKGVLYVDVDRSVPRRIIVQGRMTREGKTRDVTITMNLQDYRDVEGMLHPYRTSVRVEGMMTPEEQAQFVQMKKQLAELPPAQRQMMENMMKGQLGALERMMGDDGSMRLEGTVREVRVNAGPPR